AVGHAFELASREDAAFRPVEAVQVAVQGADSEGGTGDGERSVEPRAELGSPDPAAGCGFECFDIAGAPADDESIAVQDRSEQAVAGQVRRRSPPADLSALDVYGDHLARRADGEG